MDLRKPNPEGLSSFLEYDLGTHVYTGTAVMHPYRMSKGRSFVFPKGKA